MLQQFHRFYPQGSLVSELVEIDRGLYIVKVTAQQQGQVLGTGLAAAATVEVAEDQARERTLKVLNYDSVAPQTLSTKPALHAVTPTRVSPQSSEQPQITRQSLTQSSGQSISSEHSPVYAAPEPEPESNPEPHYLEPEPFSPSVATTAINSDTEIQTNIFDQPLNDPESVTASTTSRNVLEQPAIASVEVATPPTTTTDTTTAEFDFHDIKNRIDLEMKRLNWTKEQGRDYLLSTYGKRSRLHLTNEELLEFLGHIENLPS